MSVQEHIFFRTNLDHKALAGRLAEILGMTTIHGGNGEMFVSRRVRGGQAGDVGGEVYANLFADASAEPHEESLLDTYDVVLDVGHTGRDREVQLAEAKLLFGDLAERHLWPMALVQGLETLVAAWDPTSGLRWFPPHITPDSKDRTVWEPYFRRG